MWKLYDDLYIGIPSNIRIDRCVVGETWTVVRAGETVGIARTMEPPEDPADFAASFNGRFLRDVAGHLYWKTLAHASVGVAAMNAWYNTKERILGLEGDCAPESLPGRTAYVGPGTGADRFPLPMTPDVDPDTYGALKDYDNVVIAGEALITRALPGLFDQIGPDGHVVLEGKSLPASALFFAFGMPVRELRGHYCADPDAAETAAAENREMPEAGFSPFCIRPLELARFQAWRSAK